MPAVIRRDIKINSVADLENVLAFRNREKSAFDLTPIKSGRVSGRSCMIGTKDRRIEISGYKNVRARGVVSDELTTLGIFLRSEPGNSVWDFDIGTGDIGWTFPNVERQAIYSETMRCGMIMLKPDILEKLLRERGLDSAFLQHRCIGMCKSPPNKTQPLFHLFRGLETTLAGDEDRTIPSDAFEFIFLQLFDAFIGAISRSRDEMSISENAGKYYRAIVRGAERVFDQNSCLDLQDLSQRLNVSRSTLYRAFKNATGTSPHAHLSKRRLPKTRQRGDPPSIGQVPRPLPEETS